MFNTGDNAIVTQKITRRDNRSILYPGERVKITSVYQGEKYTIVNITPYSCKLPMVDVCCDHTGPLKKCL